MSHWDEEKCFPLTIRNIITPVRGVHIIMPFKLEGFCIHSTNQCCVLLSCSCSCKNCNGQIECGEERAVIQRIAKIIGVIMVFNRALKIWHRI